MFLPYLNITMGVMSTLQPLGGQVHALEMCGHTQRYSRTLYVGRVLYCKYFFRNLDYA